MRDDRNRSERQKVTNLVLKVVALFVLLEPIWMLLPFAGFLYGSVMHIEFLSRNPYTSWLVHFVLPTHFLFPLGLVLIGGGLAVFFVGAFQIYSAQLLKKGLVTSGIYRKFRHPQYLSLTLFGVGILLTWGRFITYIAFFVMMWLYYFLSKSEERHCTELFGEEYEEYRRHTYFLFPGEGVLLAWFRRQAPGIRAPAWAKVTASFVLVIGLSIGSGFVVKAAKQKWRGEPPTIRGTIELSEDGSRKVDLIMVKGPAFQAAPSEPVRNQFMQKALKMLTSSAKIRRAVNGIGLQRNHALLAFLNPGHDWYTSEHRDHHGKVHAFILVIETPTSASLDNLFANSEELKILKLIRARGLSYDRLENGMDPTEGEVTVSGPPMGTAQPSFTERMKDRIAFFLSGI